jgi:hypothetical protein
LDLVGPPLIYTSHLIVPMVFFARSSVFKFFLFYAVFHFLAFGVGISFTGYILVWLVLFPHREILATVGRRFSSGRVSASWQWRP